jgi:Bacterial SH3 domain
MAIAVRSHRRYVRHRPVWMRQRDAEPGAGLALGMIALLMVGIAVIGLSAQLFDVTIPRGFAHVADRAQPIRPIDGATPVPKLTAAALSTNPVALAAPADAPAAEAAPPVAAQAPASPDTLAVGGRARVANTDGVGVVLYSAPRPSARQPAGLMEGTTVTVLELVDAAWARVQTDNRRTGWIHAEYLAPTN